MTAPVLELRQALSSARDALEKAIDIADGIVGTPSVPAIGTVFGINGNHTGRNGITRTPDDRRYYQPGEFPAVPASAFLKSIEQELTISYKLSPREVIAGKHDARIISWHRAAEKGLPKLKPGRRHRTVPWHEPASEIESGQFTGQEHRAHVVHIARLLYEADLTDTFVVCPNYTMGPPQSGAGFKTEWLPDVDMAPKNSLIISGDLYDNPYGGGALSAPYRNPHEDLDVLHTAAVKHGFERVAILEVNSPRRAHDPNGVKRVEYLDWFMKSLKDYDLEFDVVDIWEGVGKWDQRFTLPNEWAFVAKLLSSSPQTRA